MGFNKLAKFHLSQGEAVGENILSFFFFFFSLTQCWHLLLCWPLSRIPSPPPNTLSDDLCIV